jgi:hypothetical protein
MFIDNLDYDMTGLVSTELIQEFGYSNYSNLEVKLGYFEAKESDNIWLRYLTPLKQDMKAF